MKLNLPKLIRPIPLADYAPEMEFQEDGKTPAVVQVWVNPPQALLAQHGELRQRADAANKRLGRDAPAGDDLKALALELSEVGQALAALYAELWSQHADPETHWTADGVLALSANDTNPDLFGWLTSRTVRLINEHRSGLRKN